MAVESCLSRLTELLGDRLLFGSTTVQLNESTFNGSLIALYFVPLGDEIASIDDQALRDLYKTVNENEKKLDIIQICYPDTIDDRKCFDELTKSVPWHTVLYEYVEKRIRLRHKYRVENAEHLLILNDNHLEKVHTRNGLKLLSCEKSFPWTDLWNEKICREALKLTSNEANDTIYGLYFSAHWCPPCKAFIPQLIHAYDKIRKRINFEIIFVSSDRSEQSYKSHASTMPWPSVPYDNNILRTNLTECFNVRGIPYLVLIDNNGNIITENGRAEIIEDPDGSYFPWRKRFVYSLSSRLLPKLQSYPAVVLFIEGDQEEELELAEGVLLPVAQQIAKTRNNALYDLLFFIAPDDDTSDTLRHFTRLTDDTAPLLTLIDIPMARISVMEYGIHITEKSIMNFVLGFFDGTMKFSPIL
ncbi:nucleoredoxin-like [Sipha flava]|uniref:Nucleoredoxin n=1 Tax=Sipha flava TaxID=143950 RepID=A0A2S2RAJ3_9HEMI|nr:nucleoredoxin-like [Sipha flava]